MTNTWILVANASVATLYASAGPKQALARVKDLAHPQSRMKNADLVSDRAGHMQSSGNGHGSRQPQTEPKQNEADHFARELAQELEQGRNAKQFERVILVAPPAFLGLINERLDTQTAKLVTHRYEKDYTQLSERELAAHLAI